jgi:DNA-binding NtrC family response regulator
LQPPDRVRQRDFAPVFRERFTANPCFRGRSRLKQMFQYAETRICSPAVAKARDTARSEALGLALEALEDLGGGALLADASLRVIAASPRAEELFGERMREGTSVTQLLCGGEVERPIAEALANERPVTGLVSRPSPAGGELTLRVRAAPIERTGRCAGWAIFAAEDAAEHEPSAPVLFHGLWTRDAKMRRVFEIVAKAARRDTSVLVRGETGTGKELVARAIHDLSPRAKAPFSAINCAALPPSLLESELFGHVRGAFTGAVRDSPGVFRAADHGTLFLDEVAEMPLEVQAKLLRVLESKTIIPVGGHEPIPVDVRIVAATHTGLRRAVEEGRFRADLMYRLRVVPIFIPPLRERAGDVELLLDKTIEELNRAEGRQVLHVSAGARAILLRYSWPGNVRELRNVLEYAYVIGEGSVLVEADFPPELVDPELAAEPRPPEVAGAPGEPQEVARIRRALERAGGNRERAARMLGISRVTLWRRLKELGLTA